VGVNQQRGVSCSIELSADLSGKVHADVQNLVGVREHGRKRWSQFQADRDGFCLYVRSQQALRGLQHRVDVDRG